MIGDRSEGIKTLTSMIGKTVVKLVWIFPGLDFFSKLKVVSTYLLTCFHMKNKCNPENNYFEINFFYLTYYDLYCNFMIYIFFFTYFVIFTLFLFFSFSSWSSSLFISLLFYSLLSLFLLLLLFFSNFHHCFVTMIILRLSIYYLIN